MTVPLYADAREAIACKTRFVPDFPVPGVIFEDLTPVLADAAAFSLIVDELAENAMRLGADFIGGLDARGFLLGSAVAYKAGTGILAIRKKGKLPPPVHSEEYSLEYGTAALELPAEGLELEDKKVVLVDDVLATGGTLDAARKLIEACGATVSGYAVVLEVDGLGGRERLNDAPLVVINEGATA
ncbi:adenine phosphoribosyltransferase [Corynebacterium diphtheriae]|uniref:adenine phosphoribosyltransferase n=1 Tax=Corynebacterium diphtheriae TaxID=1717 RepID=UPI00024681D4|nr:adenine phosphoribosyltransferase [Corynebacterium diphtheriae]AEX76763.1 adenine phosphoribosyltransferase [Corynebacterium diphtheriae HC02]MBG9252428.1 adenine phosphoribosyltransferase [Corynebacterium diphtheriae bv. mitis]MBG9274314.1 adenine phosphoribosyltransferase [Corynebacterium diphtheriae bv. mitis]MBG9289945.1 adenine phosphoribosyltransferase [Corynebacterium diphtheriae bv. gravis]OIR71420.1 adenine phosphoribosyltransferase [Corynebacterium diphtheriae]